MLLFTSLTILLIACIIGIIQGSKKDCEGVFGVSLFTGLFTLIALIALITDLPWKKQVEYDIAKYEELKVAIEQVNNVSSEYNSKIIAQSELFDKIYEMNTYIEKTKIYNDSWWLGWLYSEKIENLQLLNYIEKE